MDGPAEAVAQIQSEELDINTDPPSISEIVRSIKKLINGKKPGSENIQTEVLKADMHRSIICCHVPQVSQNVDG